MGGVGGWVGSGNTTIISLHILVVLFLFIFNNVLSQHVFSEVMYNVHALQYLYVV